MEPLNIQITDLSLETIVGAEYDGALTLADLIVNAAVTRLMKDGEYSEIQGGLRKRVGQIRDEEIRAFVKTELVGAMAAPIYRTNAYGERSGQETTLRELIVEHAKDFFTKKTGDYNRPQYTAAERVVTAAVEKELTKELAAAIADEKAKVVAAIRAKAADLIAQAVKEGVGR